MKRKLIFLLLAIVVSTTGRAAIPDFAYPQTVSKQAEVALKKALKTGDGVATVRALADLGLAQNAIGSEKLPAVVKRIEKVKNEERDSITRSLLCMLLVDIYSDIYKSDESKYNDREQPLLPLPEDYEQWSGKQFRNKISALCDEAMLPTRKLQQRKLADYSSIIKADAEGLIYYPTLYDFAAYFTIKKRKSLGEYNNILSRLYLTNWREFVSLPKIVPGSVEAVAILKTYADWLEFHKGSAFPFVNVDLQRLEFVKGSLYDSYNVDYLDDEGEEDKLFPLQKELYEKYSDSEACCDVLIAMRVSGEANRKWYFKELERVIEKFPSYHRLDCLKRDLEEMKRKEAHVSFPRSIAPGIEVEMNVESRNMAEVVVDFYKVNLSDPTAYNYKFGSGVEKLVKSVKVSFSGDVPFKMSGKENVSIDEPGYYICKVRGNVDERRSDVIRCSLLAIGTQGIKENIFYVLNPLTGTPVEGASVERVENNRNKGLTITKIGVTDKDGFYRPGFYNNYCSYIASKNNDSFGNSVSVSLSEYKETKPVSRVEGFTNLTLYHPGDTVKFVGIAYCIDGKKVTTIKDAEIKSILILPNGERTDTVKGVTDEYGRSSGDFVLPKEGLTGSGRIAFEMEGGRGSVWFTISDYKLPTFAVKSIAVLNDTPQKGYVTLKGSAESYTGVAVGNAQVKMELGSQPRYYGYGGNKDNFYSAELKTDEAGRFEIEIPAEVFKYAPYPEGVFSARITVTSTAGESRQSVKRFSLKEALMLKAEVPANFNATKPMSFSVKIEDGEQKPVIQPVEYCLMDNADSVLTKGKFMPNEAVIDFENIPSGKYTLKFFTENANVEKREIVIYRIGDKKSPVEDVLWSPSKSKKLSVEPTGKCKIILATNNDGQYCLYTVIDKEAGKMIEQKWIKLTRGVHELEVRIPANVVMADATFFAVNNFKTSEFKVGLENKELKKEPALVIESERDKIVPGSEETIKVRSCEVGKDTTGVAGALIMNMWNKALLGVEGIRVPSLDLSIYVNSPSYFINTSFYNFNISANYAEKERSNFICRGLVAPEWEFYGESFLNVSRGYGLSNRMMPMMKMASSAGATMRSENTMAYDMAAKVEMEEAVAESAVESDMAGVKIRGTTTRSEDAGDSNETGADDKFVYREVETPSAFFAPMLKTDASGRVDFSYTAPNANAQWVLQALAFDEKMQTAKAEKVYMATRPIMVQSNLPRFLRYGDSAEIRATVSNKSDRNEDVKVTTEFFDVATGAVIQRNDTTVEVNSDETAVVSVQFLAPGDKSFVGYRIKAKAGMYADGEQQILPLLAFVTPVRETYPFYMSADSVMSMRLPEMKQDARVTLQFCENPVWYVVTALPGLQKGELMTSTQAADMIFSAATARGILRKYPAVKEALAQWQKQPGDSMLQSMLQRNNDLKMILLSSTPWMADAADDTERMERLSLLFNEKEIDSAINSGIKFLKKLQCDGGGWAWHPSWKRSNEWATMEILVTLGKLNRLGFLPDDKDFASMVNKGLDWLEKEYVKIWKKDRKRCYPKYVLMRDMWPKRAQSVDGKRLTASTIQSIVANWKKYEINAKAEAALILTEHGYKPLVREILRSIKEYAVITPAKGMYWPSVGDSYGGSIEELAVAVNVLRAYNVVNPGCEEIDLIRQWLVLQKETRNWGSSSMVSDIIAEFLSAGSNWTVPAKGAVIELDGKRVDVSASDKLIGSYRTDLQVKEASGALLEVTKSSKTPAWGAVYCNYSALPTEVKAQGCDGLSVEKKMFKLVGTEWHEADSLKVGDRVRIQLILKADRAIDYVAIVDDRAACFEPVEQMPGWLYSDGMGFYRENRDSATNIFVDRMPKGTYLLAYEMWVNNAGSFASGLATAQSQYAPQITAHSGGSMINVKL